MTMNRIKILPEEVASRIAAGEVIERPASVLRELIDNSIDAQASRIIVRYHQGGKAWMSVSDDGIGMTRDDLLLSVERHATSKIRSASDLFSINTLGFRGEALPSIAAVSRLEITSKPRGEVVGHRLSVQGGKMLSIEEVGAPEGTTVEVRDIFFNLPARRKFLSGPRAETARIIELFARVALAYPTIWFQLLEGGRERFNLPPTEDFRTRLAILMGRGVAENMIEWVAEGPEVKIAAWLCPSEFSRSRGDRILTYVNRRNIKDRLLTRAIMDGYGQRLMKGSFPQVVLFLEMAPEAVDVNVHPAKQEVRFSKPSQVYKEVLEAIDQALSGSTPSLGAPPEGLAPRSSSVSEPSPQSWTLDHFPSRPHGKYPSLYPAHVKPRDLFEPEVRVVGQLAKTYILCESPRGLMIVDQHAAHERVLYEALKAGLEGSGLQVQKLLIPQEVELTPKEGRVLESNLEFLRKLGLEVQHFGGQSFLIHSVPSLLGDADPRGLLEKVVATMEEGGARGGELMERVIEAMACHSAIRAGQELGSEEMAELVSCLNAQEIPTNCPHGRPTVKYIDYRELEKMFKRVA